MVAGKPCALMPIGINTHGLPEMIWPLRVSAGAVLVRSIGPLRRLGRAARSPRQCSPREISAPQKHITVDLLCCEILCSPRVARRQRRRRLRGGGGDGGEGGDCGGKNGGGEGGIVAF